MSAGCSDWAPSWRSRRTCRGAAISAARSAARSSPPPASSSLSTFRADLLRGLRHLLQIGRVFEMHRRVRLERIRQSQFLADLAHRRHDLLPQEADAGLRILVADCAVIAPDAVDARPRLLQHAAQLGDNRLRRPEEDAPVGDLLLEGRSAARALGPSDRELDKLPAEARRE